MRKFILLLVLLGPPAAFSGMVKVSVVQPVSGPARNVMWVFGGWRDAEDRWRQAPRHIISNWGLQGLANETATVFILPDCGATVYPLAGYETNRGIIARLLEYWNSKEYAQYRALPLVMAGISTGAEGAVKLAAVTASRPRLILLSGTYDFSLIPPSSGEYRIHSGVFKTSQSWREEEPLFLLRNRMTRPLRLDIFCEENSIFIDQARSLLRQKIPGIEARGYLEAGLSHAHNWAFWASPRIRAHLRQVLTERL